MNKKRKYMSDEIEKTIEPARVFLLQENAKYGFPEVIYQYTNIEALKGII